MFLSMQNNGKVFSEKFQAAVARGCISDKRLSDEERRWTNITKTEGQKYDPDMYRVYPHPPGARYIDTIMVDSREQQPLYRYDRNAVSFK